MTKSKGLARPLPTIPTEDWDRFVWERLVRAADVLTGRQVQVAMMLASYADPNGARVRPGFDLLADDCRCSLSTAQRAVWALLEYGLLRRAVRGGGRGGGFASEYQLTAPAREADWGALAVREPGGRRPLTLTRLSGHEQPESTPPTPVDNPTLRSPATGESRPWEGALRSPVPDSPVTTDRLSGHNGDRAPQDQPRPDQELPLADDHGSEPSPESTRTREDEEFTLALSLLGSRENRRIKRGPEFRPLFTIGDAAFEGGIVRHLAALVEEDHVSPYWHKGSTDEIGRVRLRVHRALLEETLAIRRGGPSAARVRRSA